MKSERQKMLDRLHGRNRQRRNNRLFALTIAAVVIFVPIALIFFF